MYRNKQVNEMVIINDVAKLKTIAARMDKSASVVGGGVCFSFFGTSLNFKRKG